LRVEESVGHLGRSLGTSAPEELTSAAVFLFLPEGETDRLDLQPRAKIEEREGDTSPIVLQLRAPDSNRMKRVLGWTQEHERTLKQGEKAEFEIFVYNFGEEPIKGELRLTNSPEGWEIETDRSDLEVSPMDRGRVVVSLHRPEDDRGGEDNWLEWAFVSEEPADEGADPPCLAFRIIDPESSPD